MHAIAEPNELTPPHSVESEMCLLASMMLAGEDAVTFIESRAGLVAADFFSTDHGIIFATLCEMADAGKKIDAILLREELKRRQQFEEIGGMPYIAGILGSVPSAVHGPHYAKIVREKATLRGIIAAGHNAIRAAYAASDHDRASDIVQDSVTKLVRLTSSAASMDYSRAGDVAAKVMEGLEKGAPPLVNTGIAPLDEATGGIGLGEMLVIGARPSMGKSTVARQMLLRAAMLGTPTLLISLEESREKVVRNLLSSLSDVENSRLRRGQLDPSEWKPLMNGVGTLAGLPIFIADKAFRISAIRSVASMLVARHGVQLVIIDYLQRVQVPGSSAYERASMASSEVSALIKELAVGGVVLAQLNREAAKRDNKRPGMADLRESGQIEQDADQIIMLHREDYYRSTGESKDPSQDPDGIAEFIFVKFRDGCRGGTVRMKSNLQFQRFEPLADPFGSSAPRVDTGHNFL